MNKLSIILLAILIIGAGTWYFTGSEDANFSNVSWYVEDANPQITSENDPSYYEDMVYIDVEFSSGEVERHELGTAYGCNNTRESAAPELSILSCYFAATGVDFVAILEDSELRVERRAESAHDGSLDTETLLELSAK